MIYGVRMATSEARDLESAVEEYRAGPIPARQIGVKGDAHINMPPGFDATATSPTCQPLIALAPGRQEQLKGEQDIHNPKPWHGWPEFLKEIATIVIGVLIAVGAETVV